MTLNNNEAREKLVKELLRLSESAITFHTKMTGNADAPESFIRDFVAIKLFKKMKLRSSIEVKGADFKSYIVEEESKGKFEEDRQSDEKLKRFKLDLFVWSNPPYPSAILEWKKGQTQDLEKDIKRTSRLLTFCHQATIGYEIVALISDQGQIPENLRNMIAHLQEQKLCGEIIARPPVRIPDAQNNDWCTTFAIPVLRADHGLPP